MRWATSVRTLCLTEAASRPSQKHDANRSTSVIARSVAPSRSAPASEVTRPPSNAATSSRPPALPNAIPVALHCVGIGEHPPSGLNSLSQNKFYPFRDPDAPQSGRVEDGRGGLGHAATPRFPSPLIKPDVRIGRVAQPLLAFAPTDPIVRRYRNGLFRTDLRRMNHPCHA